VNYVSDGFLLSSTRPGGATRESGEYWMEMSESWPHDIQSSEGGSPCLCRLKTALVVPMQQALSCVLPHMGTNPPRNLVARRLSSWIIPYLASWMIEMIVFG
jgi:hypothetical protein